jgi:hypothetical protein
MLKAALYTGESTDWQNASRKMVLDTSKDIDVFRQDCHDEIDKMIDKFIEENEDDV